ncbi:unnamed protein product [Ophioblennius macclurei]
MPSDFLTPFLELDEEFCKSFRSLEATDGSSATQRQQRQQQQQQRVLGFQRRHSLCPVTLPNSKFNSGPEAGDPGCWGLGATAAAAAAATAAFSQLPRSALSHIPFRVDRSVSMIEGSCGGGGGDILSSPPPLMPPPGLCLSGGGGSPSSLSAASSPSGPPAPPPHISTRYKTELCRTYEESGACKYGAKCQFAHGVDELRGLSRHPKYKTEPCRTFHTIGFCPYGARCHFIHNADELQPPAAAAAAQKPRLRPPLLRHSLSFAGFATSPHAFQPVEASPPSSLLFARASSVSPPPSSAGSPELLSPLFPEPGSLKHCPFFAAVGDLAGGGGGGDSALRFFAVTDSLASRCPGAAFKSPEPLLRLPRPPPAPGLQRCSSADSLSEEGYASSCSLSSSSSGGAESPGLEGRRLPIFSSLSVTDQ